MPVSNTLQICVIDSAAEKEQQAQTTESEQRGQPTDADQDNEQAPRDPQGSLNRFVMWTDKDFKSRKKQLQGTKLIDEYNRIQHKLREVRNFLEVIVHYSAGDEMCRHKI